MGSSQVWQKISIHDYNVYNLFDFNYSLKLNNIYIFKNSLK